jgi:hypothetical protein
MVDMNFYEKALFVKPTWRPRSMWYERQRFVPFALCFYSHSRGALCSVARCI